MTLKVTYYNRNKIIKELWSWKKVITCLHRLPKLKDASLYNEQKEEKKKAKRRPLAFYHLPLLLTLVKLSCLFTPYLSVLVLSCLISSVAQSCPTLSDPMDCSMPGLPIITNSGSLLKLISIELVMPSSHLILYCPILLLPSIFLNIRVFSSKSVLRIR